MLNGKTKKYSYQKESLKLNKNQNKFRNNSTNHFFVKDLYNKVLPKINLQNDNYDPKLTESNLKSSLASTFYSTNEKKQKPKLITEYINFKNKNKVIYKYVINKQMSYLKKKKNLEINPTYFDIKKTKNNNNDIDLYIKEDYENLNINRDNEYSNLIKKLDRWDEDNCLVKSNDKITLYNNLNNFYKKKSMFQELKNLNTMESLLKSKTNYDKLLKDRLDYKNNKINSDILVPKNGKDHKNLFNHNYKRNERNRKAEINKFQFETDDLRLLSEKIKYETQLHNDLIFVNSILYNKKLLKTENLKRLEELYKTRAELKNAYDKNYNYNMKDYWSRYDEYEHRYKKLENLITSQSKKDLENEENDKENLNEKDKEEEIDNNQIKDEEEKNNKETLEKMDNSTDENNIRNKNRKFHYTSPSPRKRSNRKQATNTDVGTKRTHNRKMSSSQTKFMKEMNFIKATKINTINFEMKKKMERLRLDYQKKIKEIDEIQVKLEEEIKINKNEISYYKQVNEELIREYRNYYLKILKKGNDHRKEGLVWVVKNLLELQINLEYQHFPKYLTHEQIDYLIELAHLLLEQSELIIIIKVLRKKQTTTYIDENIQAYNMLDKYMEEHIKEKNITGNNKRKSLMGDKNIYEKNMYAIIDEIDKKFDKVYKNNKEIVKHYLEKNEEDVKLRNALEHIKKGLYNSDKFIKENQASILDAFIGNSKNKDFFSFILNIRNRLNQLEVIITNLIKKEKDYYIEQIQKYNSATKNFDINFYKEVIKKSLFGEKFELYE
jgi:hypothetical protein